MSKPVTSNSVAIRARIASSIAAATAPSTAIALIAAIKAVAVDGYVAATIDDAIRTRMATEFDVTGFDTVHQWRTNGYEYAEESDGKTYWHDGGRYSIELHKT